MRQKHNDYYVYIHRRNDNNEVFYVGKGRRDRAKCSTGRNKWWCAIVAKAGFSVEFVEKGMSEESAYDLEVEVIKFYKESGHTLCNISPGGVGGAGSMPKSDETRKKMSDARKRVPVACSNGMTFSSMMDAARWYDDPENFQRLQRGISDCCAGRRGYVRGLKWWKIEQDTKQVA